MYVSKMPQILHNCGHIHNFFWGVEGAVMDIKCVCMCVTQY